MRVGFVRQAAVEVPTLVKFTGRAECAAGEQVLAGGYNLTLSDGTDEWLAAHPAPKEAQPDKTYGLYRPIPTLLRVIESVPAVDLQSWFVTVEGMLYPSEGARSLMVSAYCATGLSGTPRIARATITTQAVGSQLQIAATCPEATIAVGGGYTAGTYNYAGGTKSAHVPVYRSLKRRDGWEVATDSFNRQTDRGLLPAFTPYPSGLLTAVAVCASAFDFEDTSGPNHPELYVSPETPELHIVTTQVGGDLVYGGKVAESSPCSAGQFLLVPSYNVYPNDWGDVRIDAVWVDATFSTWTVAVSTGGAATYPGGPPILSAYATCLQFKANR